MKDDSLSKVADILDRAIARTFKFAPAGALPDANLTAQGILIAARAFVDALAEVEREKVDEAKLRGPAK